MTDRRTGMPTDHVGDSDKQGVGVQGLAGERTEDRGVERPEMQREVDTGERVITVEESSGTAFAESHGAAEQTLPDPDADGGVQNNALPESSRA
ncbi:hypothetical protein [Sphingomonas xinjiangensis]|uniref:Uncharacterized protein n=1 Tax=Sphingomonas xinjiangensis TaxID=643568 RepID=A0A840YNN8_9SPHN|nr:hypothetical protein [Sphingomonas xinjiangensis]MBB5711936.1 hypothetical protein [Sphingomonas xinjiangensis]